MQDISELERRITAAMERITRGVDALSQPLANDGDHRQEILRLTEALDEERMANAQLNERLRVIRQKEDQNSGQPDQLAELTGQLAAKTEELNTLRRVLAEAGKEISALRAERASAAAELADVAAALEPLIEEAAHHA
jgi:chromosome segregation ATPase